MWEEEEQKGHVRGLKCFFISAYSQINYFCCCKNWWHVFTKARGTIATGFLGLTNSTDATLGGTIADNRSLESPYLNNLPRSAMAFLIIGQRRHSVLVQRKNMYCFMTRLEPPLHFLKKNQENLIFKRFKQKILRKH